MEMGEEKNYPKSCVWSDVAVRAPCLGPTVAFDVAAPLNHNLF